MVLSVLLQSAALLLLQQGPMQGPPGGFQIGEVKIPPYVGVVNDFAHIIPADRAALIEQIANDVRTKSRGELVVVTLPDIGQREESDVALQIGRHWKVGKIGNAGDPSRNAGAVILIVPKETSSDGRGRCWVATGSGAEGFITDADAGDMCRAAVPAFKARDYGAGIASITYATAARFAQEFHFALDTTLRVQAPTEYEQPRGRTGFPPQLVFLAVVFLILMLSNRRRGGCGCLPIFFPFPMGGGGGGWGGGGGFGGGGFSGGGGFGGFGGGGGFSGGGGGARW